jgi:hypothetical protein
MKILKVILALLFVLFAYVQLNDPDPGLWILVYGLMAVLSVMAYFNKYPVKIMIVMAAGYLVMSIMHFDGMVEWLLSPNRKLLFDDFAKMQYWYIEEAREFLGLLVCLAVIIFYFYQSRREKQS